MEALGGGRGVAQGTSGEGSGGVGVAPTGGGRRVQFGVKSADNLNPLAADCYFYYYSSCSKGDQCKFRHCSAALGTEEVCDLWLNGGECKRQVCAFRHAVPERQRSAIPCFWETQAIGCLKPHCTFLHTKPRPKMPSAYGRLQQFDEDKFAALKVKSLDEIREEKQLTSSVTPSPPSQVTHSHPHSMSYNRTYRPSHTTHPPTSTSSQTSFKLTSVLQSTGLSGKNRTNSTKPSPHTAVMGESVATSNQNRPNFVSQSSKTAPQSNLNQHKSTLLTQQAQVEDNVMIKSREPAHAKVGVASMSVQKPATMLFGPQDDPSSVFSPNYKPRGKTSDTRMDQGSERVNVVGIKTEERNRRSRDGGVTVMKDAGSIATISWEGEGEGEGEGRRGTVSRVVKLSNSTSTADPVPLAKKVKLAPSSVTTTPKLVRPLPTAASSLIKAPEKEKDPSVTSKVGVAISGRVQHGSGGFGDFRVKSLEEIRAEKRKRQGGNGGEKSVQVATEAPVLPTATVKPQQAAVERKIVRLKKRVPPARPPGAEKKNDGGGNELREGGGSEEGRGERGESNEGGEAKLEHRKTVESESARRNVPLEDVSVNEQVPLPVGKRRKLSRTPLSAVQATPTTNIPSVATVTVPIEQPQATTDDQSQPHRTKIAQESTPPPPAVSLATEDEIKRLDNEKETSLSVQLPKGREEREQVGRGREGVKGVEGRGDRKDERKMSISEMKAQIQCELRDRRDSELLSTDQLESELAQWEEELEGEGEGEGGEDEDDLLNSKTDDDLMLEFAEFL